MFSSSSLLKTALHGAIAEGIYNELTTRQSRYYYFLGKSLTWEDELMPPSPIDSIAYERGVRNEMLSMKEIGPSDVAFVIPRYDWETETVYDQYDDELSDQVIEINLRAGGSGYTIQPFVYIGNYGALPWSTNTEFEVGRMVTVSEHQNYIVTQSGISSSSVPTHTNGTAMNGTVRLQFVEVNNGNGTGARAEAVVMDGVIIDIALISRGMGYTSIPTVTIGGIGIGAEARATVPISASGKQRIEECIFYVMTDDYNVYQCLDNNRGALSTFKPIGTSVDPIRYPDGYIWKFLYTIPPALRNKFLNEVYIPVTNSLRNQFYSNGNIQYVRVDQGGENYNAATITVQGDGYLESDPLYITGFDIDNVGSGYSFASLNIDPPFSSSVPWTSEQNVIVGTRLSYDNNIYSVATSGETGTIPPTHKFGTVSNGDASLTYIGTTITGDLTIVGGEITDVTLYGMLRDIIIIEGGSGYTSAPQITFSSSSGTGADAVASIQGGFVNRIIINDSGENYTEEPTVIVGTEWEENTFFGLGEQIFVANRLYTVTEAGTTDTTAPTHFVGSEYSGTVLFEYAGVAAKAIADIKFGAGYSTVPNVYISGNGSGAQISLTSAKSEAKLVPIIDGNEIVGVQIDDGGIGYTYANLVVSGDGTGAQLSADLSPGDVNTLQSNVELLTVEGSIVNCPVTSGGYNYGTAVVNIVGDGTGATATAEIANGRVSKITMTNYGSGYTWARIEILGNAGARGAKARAIISPYGGFGKDSISGLYARTLMFYSNISNEKNQGFTIDNEYRQAGVIKSPKQYGTTYNLNNTIASTCWAISATNNPVFFPNDSLLYLVAENSPRFRVVSNTGEAILLQSLDNAEPVIGSQFVNDSNDMITVNGVAAPTADKYSGDLLFIDNRKAFTPSESETISLRTVIRF